MIFRKSLKIKALIQEIHQLIPLDQVTKFHEKILIYLDEF